MRCTSTASGDPAAPNVPGCSSTPSNAAATAMGPWHTVAPGLNTTAGVVDGAPSVNARVRSRLAPATVMIAGPANASTRNPMSAALRIEAGGDEGERCQLECEQAAEHDTGRGCAGAAVQP